ncbi:MAG: TonB family protein [Gallionella sp.]
MMKPLQVVLVNSKSQTRPDKADALAQANLDGGGNTTEDRQAKTSLPTISDDQQFTPEQITKRVAELEQESKRLMTRLKSDKTVALPAPKNEQSSDNRSGEDLVQRSLEIARLEAQISKNNDAYQKLPHRRNIGARTKGTVEALYVEHWRHKIEEIGNLNYPAEVRRRKLFGKLQLTVSINPDGSIPKGGIEVARSSGNSILDAAAVNLVKISAPFAAIPPDILREYKDGISITRTWNFTSTDRLEAE